MPLYTYIVTYRGDSYVALGRRSNFRGFIDAWADPPTQALPTLTPALRRELEKKAFYGDFTEVPNRKRVWKKVIDLAGSEFIVFAIDTRD